jgi:hypothetical protein
MKILLLLLVAVVPAFCIDKADEIAIRAAALDYLEVWYEGNAERMDRALHPDLIKRNVVTKSGKAGLRTLTKDQMVEFTRNGGGRNAPAAKRAVSVVILEATPMIAAAKAESGEYCDYLQLAKVDGAWKIVHVLWEHQRSK